MRAPARVWGTWVRACRGVGASDHVLAEESCLSRDESVSRKRIRHTLVPSAHPSELGVGIRSCPRVSEEEPPAHRSFVCFRCESRRWLRHHVKQSVQKFLTKAHSRLFRHVGQWSRGSRCMHALGCLLVSAGVPRMRLCSSLSVVAHLFCRLVFFFSTRSWFFLRSMSRSTPCEKFQFLDILFEG